jgi:LEA14-like dessication related protein
MTRASALAVSLAVAAGMSACATAPVAPPAAPPELLSQDLAIDQDLSTFNLELDGQARSEQAATIVKANWELVVDGKVVQSGEEPIDVKLEPGSASSFKLKAASRYVTNAEDLKAMSDRGGSMLAALRGTLQVRQGDQMHALDFARSREVRTPRLPSVKMNDLDGARFSAEEVNINCYLGVVNPNPFPLRVESLTYKVEVAGKQISEGTRAHGDSVSPASTGVFDVQVAVSKETFGPEVKKLIASGQVPYVITGELKGDLYSLPYKLTGSVKIYDSSK